jgi:hypothetical protein
MSEHGDIDFCASLEHDIDKMSPHDFNCHAQTSRNASVNLKEASMVLHDPYRRVGARARAALIFVAALCLLPCVASA